jgi:hypothetical protein
LISLPCPFALAANLKIADDALNMKACLATLAFTLFSNSLSAAEPIRLHPQNPHYFLWRGQPTVLITSAEHYGAVLNLDFDYVKYLKTLAADKLNNTRVFTGAAYVEPQGAFNITRNTLAPGPSRFISPFARSNTPGYAGGGNKFDLSRWDEQFFERLRDFSRHASQNGVVVELVFFCPFYEDSQWELSPFNAANNVNGLGNVTSTNVFTLDKHGGLLAPQERVVRRIVEELREFDNVYYEICNEPYFGGITMEWQHHIADIIVDAQKNHRHPKLISQNIANNTAKIENPHPAISIFNFHYAAPPDAVAMNFHLNKVIGDNETGFRGTNDAPYRMEGWDFIIAGGALYNNLDYSFAAGYEDGTFAYPSTQPGGGNPGFRKQMRYLSDFINSFDFINMRPDNSLFVSEAPQGLSARALAIPGKAYAIYLRPSLVTQFSARWTGQIEPRFSEEYTFFASSNDGVRLWINDQLLIDNWVEQGEKEVSGKIGLEGGRSYPVRIDYFYNGGQAAMKFLWSSASQRKEPVPTTALAWKDGSARGLKGEYFTGVNFDQPWRTRNDPSVNFSWGTRTPFPVDRSQEPVRLEVNLPKNSYQAGWFNTVTGQFIKTEDIQHTGGVYVLEAPRFREDIALSIKAR